VPRLRDCLSLRALLAGGAVPGRMRVTATPVPGSWSGARACPARGRCPPYQPAQRVIVLASHAAFPQPLRVNVAEDRSASSFRHRDLDLHQTPSVHDDALELLAVYQNHDELTFVKGLHSPSLLAPARAARRALKSPTRALASPDERRQPELPFKGAWIR
jgi:hypothetical protein